MSFLVLFFCSYTATQRSNEMLLFTFWILSSCPLEETSYTLSAVSLYLHLISQGGLQSAEQLYGRTNCLFFLNCQFPIIKFRFWVNWQYARLVCKQVCSTTNLFLLLYNKYFFLYVNVLKIWCLITNHCAS